MISSTNMDDFDKIATDYVESLGEILHGFKFGYSNKREFFFEIYYDFILINLDESIPSELPVAGGPAGFIVDKNSYKTKMLSFGELGLLIQRDEELENVYSKLKDIKEDSKSLSWLKSRYNLNSIQLLRIKKMLTNIDFNKQYIIKELDELITKNQ